MSLKVTQLNVVGSGTIRSATYHHHGRAYTVLRATSWAYGEWQNWQCQNSETSEPINIKFGMGDYVGDIIPKPKFKTIAPVRASRHMGEISL